MLLRSFKVQLPQNILRNRGFWFFPIKCQGLPSEIGGGWVKQR